MDKREKIVRLASIFSTDEKIISFFDQMLESVAADVDKNDFVKMSDFVHEKMIPAVLDDIYNEYDKGLDEESIDKLLAYYESEEGKKILALLANIEKNIAELSTTKWQDMLVQGAATMGILDSGNEDE